MRVYLKTLGCRLNEAELEGWARQFQSGGCALTTRPEDADLIVLNSCAVTGDAERKSRNLIRRLRTDNPSARLVASGCWVSLRSEEAAAGLGVDLAVSNVDKSRLVEITRTRFGWVAEPSPESQEPSLFQMGRQRAFVKVQDGCRHRCAFCIVTVARGGEHSRPAAEVVAEINACYAEGVQEAVLTGVHLGGWSDGAGRGLDDLLRVVLAETAIPRIRLGSLEPWALTEDALTSWQNPRLMPHLHLPLQSGSDSVLKRMARRGRTKDFARLLESAHRHVPHLVVTTDLMAGFPGESETEWRQGLEFVTGLPLGRLHVFPYSARAGTAAAAMPLQVPDRVKKARVAELRALSVRLEQHSALRQVGDVVDVLWEDAPEVLGAGRLRRFGYAPNYHRVAVDVAEDAPLAGRITSARLMDVLPDRTTLVGVIC